MPTVPELLTGLFCPLLLLRVKHKSTQELVGNSNGSEVKLTVVYRGWGWKKGLTGPLWSREQ